MTNRKISYDFDWFENHTPFKKILENYCDLEIKKNIVERYIHSFIKVKENHYSIKVNYEKFILNFDEIKKRLLNTNICKNCTDVNDMVSDLKCDKHDLCWLIIDGCIANCSGYFDWHFE